MDIEGGKGSSTNHKFYQLAIGIQPLGKRFAPPPPLKSICWITLEPWKIKVYFERSHWAPTHILDKLKKDFFLKKKKKKKKQICENFFLSVDLGVTRLLDETLSFGLSCRWDVKHKHSNCQWAWIPHDWIWVCLLCADPGIFVRGGDLWLSFFVGW